MPRYQDSDDESILSLTALNFGNRVVAGNNWGDCTGCMWSMISHMIKDVIMREIRERKGGDSARPGDPATPHQPWQPDRPASM